MKQWEQIIFAIALAALGYVLYQFNDTASGKNKNTWAQGALPAGTVPQFYSYNTINTLPGAAPSLMANSVPIQPDNVGQIGQNYYLDPEQTLFPTNNIYGG